MKRAKQRKYVTLKQVRRRPHYRLADLQAQMPGGQFEWTPELRAWEEMEPVGRESGSDKSL